MLAIVYWNVHKGKAIGLPDAIIELAEATANDATLSGAKGEVLLCFSEAKKVNFDTILKKLCAKYPGRTWWQKRSLSGNFVCMGTVPEANVDLASEVNGSLPCTLIRSVGAVPQNYEIWFALLAPTEY